MESHRVDIPYKLIQKLVTGGGSFVAIVFVFIFRDIFKIEFTCPCESNQPVNSLSIGYAVLPFVCFTLLFILIDNRCLKICGWYNCRAEAQRHWRFLSCLVCGRVLRALCAGSMWMVTILNDGHWYVCVRTIYINRSAGQMHIACEEEKNLTLEETLTLNRLETESHVIGLGFLCGIVFIWAVGTCFSFGCEPYYITQYRKYLEQETDTLLEDKMKQRAKSLAQRKCNRVIAAPFKDRDFWWGVSRPTFHLSFENPSGFQLLDAMENPMTVEQ